MDTKTLGLLLIGIGAAVAVVGWLVLSGWFGGFGRLPGDIRIVSDGTHIYIPFTSMVLVSLILTVVVNVLRRLP